MKFLIKITKGIIDRSIFCGTLNHPQGVEYSDHCALSEAIGELVPARVQNSIIIFKNKDNDGGWSVDTTVEQRRMIRDFDGPIAEGGDIRDRYQLVGREVEVEIPDPVIEYWYGDAVKAVERIANSKTLIPV